MLTVTDRVNRRRLSPAVPADTEAVAATVFMLCPHPEHEAHPSGVAHQRCFVSLNTGRYHRLRRTADAGLSDDDADAEHYQPLRRRPQLHTAHGFDTELSYDVFR